VTYTYLVKMILSYSPIYVFSLCNSEFDAQTWRPNHQPMQKQLDNMRRSGIQGRPNFVTWFKERALRVSNVHRDLCHLSYGYITVRRYGPYDVNGFHFHSSIFEHARPLAATCNTGVVVRGTGSFEFCYCSYSSVNLAPSQLSDRDPMAQI
jgi:hypothetical protein